MLTLPTAVVSTDLSSSDSGRDLGCAANPRRIAEARHQGLPADGRTADDAVAKAPSQTWRAFVDNHVEELVSIDVFTVPTATFWGPYSTLSFRSIQGDCRGA